MLKRTLLFSNPYHICAKQQQMLIQNKSTGVEKSVPVEDLAFVVLEHPQITFTQGIMQLMAEHNVAVIFCDNKYLPSSIALSLDANHIQTKIIRAQVIATEPLKKSLWKQTIKYKITNQANVLEVYGLHYKSLQYFANNVKSGDTGNEESKAAVVYWKTLFGPDFRRIRYGNSPNNLLNYGYAILRSAVARALVGSGLHPTLGIHHRNKYNSYCLADDIMEPYRPYVDMMVKDFTENYGYVEELTTDTKAYLLDILTQDVMIQKKQKPLMVALSSTTASLAKCYLGEKKKLNYPIL